MPEFESKLKRLLMAPARAIGAVLHGLTNASEKFERVFIKAATSAARVGDAASTADSLVGRLFKGLLSPLIWIWQRLLSPLLDALNTSPLIRSIGRATYWIWYPFVALASFARTFLQTRTRALILWSLPFMVVVGGTLFMLWSLNPRRGDVSQQYIKAIKELRERGGEGNFEQAALYQQKLQSLGIRTEQAEMRQINELVKAGKLPQAIDMAKNLAPLDRPGFPEAHFWLANRYLMEEADLKGRESLDRAEQHLTLLEAALQPLRVDESKPVPQVVMLKSMIALEKADAEQGLSLLKSISNFYGPALLLQMKVHIRLEMQEEAIRDAVTVSELAEKNPEMLDEVSPQFFPMWCRLLAAGGEREKLKNAVFVWHRKFPADPSGLVAWAEYQFREIDVLMDRGSASDMQFATKLLVEMTNQLGLQNQPLISLWWKERSTLDKDKQNERTVQNYFRLAELATENPDLCSTLLEIWGTEATQQGDHQRALVLLKRATEKDPENAIAWNNLAFVANSHFENEIDLARVAADKAAQIQPQNIDILHTRGFVRIKLKQWESAISDLRTVIAERPNAADVHLGLSQAYNALGNKEMAAIHQELAR